MKKLTAISLFIFWALVAALLTSGLVFYQNNKQARVVTQNPLQVPGETVMSMRELAKHDNTSDCWLLIGGKIYDVTSYIYQHPGESSTIIPTCGTDATRAYNTKGRTTNPKGHSQNAHKLLKQFYVGDIGQAPTAPIQTTAQPATPIVAMPKPITTPTITLSTQEVAKHNTTSNCWLTIGGNVYNVTSYLGQHPGGIAAVKPYCGKDGSAAFEGLPHSTNAHQLLANFLIGAVGQRATTQTIQRTAIPTIPLKTAEMELEDD